MEVVQRPDDFQLNEHQPFDQLITAYSPTITPLYLRG